MVRRRAPMRFVRPSLRCAGPSEDLLQGADRRVATRELRGSAAWPVAMPQCQPCPGASTAAANGAPIITASAPHTTALAMSPPVTMPPSAMTCTYTPVSSRWRMRAARASAMAVAWATPTPSTRAGGGGLPRPDADEDPGRAGAHEVEGRLVARAAADDHRDVELAHERLEVERLGDALGDVLGRDHRALDDQQVELGVEELLGVGRDALRGHRRRTTRRRRSGSP